MANGTLAGSVTDIRNNMPIADATVDATSEGGGQQYKATSNDNGQWGPESVPADTYDITVTANGYAQGIYPGILVLEDVTTQLPFALHPADTFD